MATSALAESGTHFMNLIESFEIHFCSETMSCVQIWKETCFFIYCPLLPIIWILDSFIRFAIRQYKVNQRKKRYRAKRAMKRKKKDDLFLSLDAYSRGTTDMLEFDQNDDYFDTDKRELGGKKSEGTKEKRERRKKGGHNYKYTCIFRCGYFLAKNDKLEMEDEEFVSPQKAKFTDKSKEKDEDLESEQSLSDTSDADEVSHKK